MIRYHCLWLFLLSLLFTQGLAGALDETSSNSLVKIDLEQLKEKIEAKKEKAYSFHIIDLRNEADFIKGAIPGAINIPFSKLRFVAETTFKNKDDEIILYTYQGSERITENGFILLQQKGFSNIKILKDGFVSWEEKVE